MPPSYLTKWSYMVLAFPPLDAAKWPALCLSMLRATAAQEITSLFLLGFTLYTFQSNFIPFPPLTSIVPPL